MQPRPVKGMPELRPLYVALRVLTVAVNAIRLTVKSSSYLPVGHGVMDVCSWLAIKFVARPMRAVTCK